MSVRLGKMYRSVGMDERVAWDVSVDLGMYEHVAREVSVIQLGNL